MVPFSMKLNFLKNFSKSENNKGVSKESKQQQQEEYGINEQLINYVKKFTADTFKNFTLQDSRAEASGLNVRKDLTEWQERHATLLLSSVKEISQIRFYLCPRYLKDEQFWRIYFQLVRDYVAPYKIKAIQKAKIQQMGLEDNKTANDSVEVEMTETRKPVLPSTSERN